MIWGKALLLGFMLVISLIIMFFIIVSSLSLGEINTYFSYGEKALGNNYILNYSSRGSDMIVRQKGGDKANPVIVSFIVDGYYYNSKYIVAVQRPIRITSEYIQKHIYPVKKEKCKYHIINKSTHQHKIFTNLDSFNTALVEYGISSDKIIYNTYTDETMPCPKK